ncbi:uncharacterized protein LOC104457334 [Eucalyptus grandis]|uniref:uncharacterized protein LOC104457334 n=1 Tax=Eucalyptus grandis TaxID=71139 RepID=UPI00192ECED2|nr:uncharacterized protein LOC104457334 [Eucalyptus grandis]
MPVTSLYARPQLYSKSRGIESPWVQKLGACHESVAYHGKLRLLNLSGCSELHHLCDVLQANNLQSINLRDCSKLQNSLIFQMKTKALLNLHLDRTPIKELFASIENLVSLKDMTLSSCKNLAILPSSIYKLQNLERLILDGCSKLINFPKKDESSDPHVKIGFPRLYELNLRKCSLLEVDFLEKHSCFSYFKNLNLSGNNFTNLSLSEQLHNLLNLDVSYCQQLEEVLEIPGHVDILKAVSCESLRKISTNKCPARSMDLSSCYELVRHGFTVNDFIKPEVLISNWVLLPGEDMPKWLLPNKDGCISFLASKDLYEKIGGLAWAIVHQVKKGNKNAKLKIQAYVNGERMNKESDRAMPLDLNHVAFGVIELKDLWKEVSFGPNGYWNHFQCSITASVGVIVKKCGFRLICKSLENELEVLLQDDQLHDPTLFYEVLDENQTSTELDSPREFVHKGLDENQMSTEEDSLGKFVHKGVNMTDFSIEKYRYSQISPAYRNVLLGGEMPEQFVLVEDGTISFMASQDLYDKFLGLALCVVFNVEDRKGNIFRACAKC